MCEVHLKELVPSVVNYVKYLHFILFDLDITENVYFILFTVDDGLDDDEVNMRNGRDKGKLFSSQCMYYASDLYVLLL